MRPRTWVLLLAALFALMQLGTVEGRDTPDSKNYVSYALSLTGVDKREAAAVTIDHYCAGKAAMAHRAQNVDVVRFHAPDPAPRVLEECREQEWRQVEARLAAGETGGHTVPFMPERFMRIFEVRPGYPLVLAPFVALLGVTWGVWAAGVVITCAGGVFAYLVLRTLAAPVPLALTGMALYLVLPCGTTAMRPMTEGLMLALTLAALWGCALVLGGTRPRAGLALVGGASAALFTVKHSQALFLGACLAAAGVAVVAGRRWQGVPAGRGPVALAAVGCAGVFGTVLVSRLLGYPSVSESVQDLLTGHFARPDRVEPWAEFFQLQGNFWMEWARRQLWEPVFLAALAAGALGARRRPAFGAFLVAAACTGFLNQAGHPDINIWGDRLITLAWLLPVLGVPLLLERVLRRAVVPAQGAPVEPVG
ncbi:hypothetical protein [Streptomyces sp. SudanB66_2053]|uniref:hypothetical protein n=1 Tax=Streptomyces sp. SudanB66_2053 TaxID=3035277 RepID=UPI003F557D46